MGKSIDRVDVREKLPVRREPYWKRLAQGRYVGYRRISKSTPGTWLARAYVDAGYVYEKLGDFATVPEKERYDEAVKAAERHFRHLDLGGVSDKATVKSACVAYLKKLRSDKSEKAASDAEGFFSRLVYDDPIARVQLAKLTKNHMSGWRERALEHNGNHGSFNRNVVPLRAALNLALENGGVATDQAWLRALRPFKGAAKRRTLYLDRDERRTLLEKASDEARPLFTAMALLPMRPGELAALRVEHLNARHRTLQIPTGKTEARVIPLSVEAFSHFKECAKGKLPSAWLIARDDGAQWKKEAWRDEIKAAATAAKLPKATVAYTLRHSVITDLVTGGLDLFTVAKLAGTSILMIERHYGHLQREHARAALEKLGALA